MSEKLRTDEIAFDLKGVTLAECLPSSDDLQYAQELLEIAENLPNVSKGFMQVLVDNFKKILVSISEAIEGGEALIQSKGEGERELFLKDLIFNTALLEEYAKEIAPLIASKIYEVQEETFKALGVTQMLES